MVKTTKRARKFNAKVGTGSDASTKKKSLLSSSKKKSSKRPTKTSSDIKAESKAIHDEEIQKAKKLRNDIDFTNVDNLGSLDIESFFDKVVDGLEGKDNSDGEEEDDTNNKTSNTQDDDESSIDSLNSLNSEESDIHASEQQMKDQLAKLGEQDPEFHKYLKENDSNLLDFDMNDEDSDDGEYEQDEDKMESLLADATEDDDEEEDTTAKQFKPQKQQDKFLLTPLRLQQLEQGAFQSHSIKGLKRIVGGYRTVCHLSDVNTQQSGGDSDEGEGGKSRKKREFQITSPVVFDRLMAVCLVQCHTEFYYHLLREEDDGEEEESSSSSGSESSEDDGDKAATKKKSTKATASEESLDENKPLHPKTLSKSSNWITLRPIIESFLKSTLHILTESGKEAKLLQFVLSSLSKYTPYLTSYPKLIKPYLKTLVSLWSAPIDNSEEYNTVRLQSFLRIRQLAIVLPYPSIEDILKMTYLSYAKRAKFGTASNISTTLPTLTFMGNCLVELYTLDYASSYQHIFIYVRQLALHLRNALMKQTQESMSVVCCWQYVHCLKVWVAVLCAACGTKTIASGDDDGGASSKLGGGVNKDEEANLLASLVYPLTEIILGACRLVPNVRFVPLRLHCVRLLQQLAASTETFIPTTSLLLGVLDMKEVGMKPLRDGKGGKGKKNKGSSGTVRGLRLPLILKLPKENTLRTMEQLDSVLKETFVLLNREVDMYRYSPGFPEFTFAILQRLRKVSCVGCILFASLCTSYVPKYSRDLHILHSHTNSSTRKLVMVGGVLTPRVQWSYVKSTLPLPLKADQPWQMHPRMFEDSRLSSLHRPPR